MLFFINIILCNINPVSSDKFIHFNVFTINTKYPFFSAYIYSKTTLCCRETSFFLELKIVVIFIDVHLLFKFQSSFCRGVWRSG